MAFSFLLLIAGIASAATVTPEAREKALRSARVWNEPRVPIHLADLSKTEVGDDGFRADDEITCDWQPYRQVSGVTAKFYCKTKNGDVLKIKYSTKNGLNPEVYAETAGTRLLRALGFEADRMYLVKKVRCIGCPKDPVFVTLLTQHKIKKVRDNFYAIHGIRENGQYVYRSDEPFYDFYEVAIERKTGKKIESKEDQGWGWDELDRIDPKLGSSVAEVDAFRIMASFLTHSDNKAANHSLVCLKKIKDGQECEAPVAFVADIGVAFGGGFNFLTMSYPKFDLTAWEKSQVWSKDGPCTLHLKNSLTGSFKDVTVGEEGRNLAARLLNSLSDGQIRDLFNGVNISNLPFKNTAHNNVEEWLRVFKAKRDVISSASCQR